MAGTVVCLACGAKMKAGRGYCLRCGEPLPTERPPGGELQSSNRGLLLIGGAAVSFLVLAAGVSDDLLQKPSEAADAYRRYLELAPGAPEASSVKARLQALTKS